MLSPVQHPEVHCTDKMRLRARDSFYLRENRDVCIPSQTKKKQSTRLYGNISPKMNKRKHSTRHDASFGESRFTGYFGFNSSFPAPRSDSIVSTNRKPWQQPVKLHSRFGESLELPSLYGSQMTRTPSAAWEGSNC